MDPDASFQCKGPSIFSTFYGLTQMKIIIGYTYPFNATKMGSRDSGETKVDPHWVQDPPWSFNGPCHGPKIHPTWPFIYWLYLCILCIKNGGRPLCPQSPLSHFCCIECKIRANIADFLRPLIKDSEMPAW